MPLTLVLQSIQDTSVNPAVQRPPESSLIQAQVDDSDVITEFFKWKLSKIHDNVVKNE
ncbi:MAG TPA: hypothetical protein VGF75_00505 [Candidatus Saccharimonadales bacterium]